MLLPNRRRTRDEQIKGGQERSKSKEKRRRRAERKEKKKENKP